MVGPLTFRLALFPGSRVLFTVLLWGWEGEEDPISKALQALGPVGSEITMGAVLGFCSGYAVKKVGKAAAFVVGVTFIATQVRRRESKDVDRLIDRCTQCFRTHMSTIVTRHCLKIARS